MLNEINWKLSQAFCNCLFRFSEEMFLLLSVIAMATTLNLIVL